MLMIGFLVGLAAAGVEVATVGELIPVLNLIIMAVGVGMVFVRIGRRDQQIDTLASAVTKLATHVDLLRDVGTEFRVVSKDMERRLSQIDSRLDDLSEKTR